MNKILPVTIIVLCSFMLIGSAFSIQSSVMTDNSVTNNTLLVDMGNWESMVNNEPMNITTNSVDSLFKGSITVTEGNSEGSTSVSEYRAYSYLRIWGNGEGGNIAGLKFDISNVTNNADKKFTVSVYEASARSENDTTSLIGSVNILLSQGAGSGTLNQTLTAIDTGTPYMIEITSNCSKATNFTLKVTASSV